MSESPQPPHEAAFFSTIRSWDIQRGPGVLGGVATGWGAKVGMAATPARILTVLAGIALPGIALLAYAAGWALLPDRRGAIVIQDFGRGVTNVGALIGIAIMAVLGLSLANRSPVLNIDGGPWNGSSPFHLLGQIFSIVIPLTILGGATALVLYLVRRNKRGPFPPDSTGTVWSSTMPQPPSGSHQADAPVAPGAPTAHAADSGAAGQASGVAEPPVQGTGEASDSGESGEDTGRSDDAPAATAPSVTAVTAATPATAAHSYQPAVGGRPLPWQRALLPGEVPVNAGSPAAHPHHDTYADAPPAAASAYAWSASTGAPVPPPAPRQTKEARRNRPPRPPKVPGPGKAAWIAFLGVMVLSVAIVYVLARTEQLAVSEFLAWGVCITIGLGAILVIVALSGRRLGLLGLLSACAVAVSIPLIATADQQRIDFRPWIDSDGIHVNLDGDGDTDEYGQEFTEEPVNISQVFGDDYSTVYLAGSCTTWTAQDRRAEILTNGVDAHLALDSVEEDVTYTIRGTLNEVTVPAGVGLIIKGGDIRTVFADRDVACEQWEMSPEQPRTQVDLHNAEGPVVTLIAPTSATIIINEEVSQ